MRLGTHIKASVLQFRDKISDADTCVVVLAPGVQVLAPDARYRILRPIAHLVI